MSEKKPVAIIDWVEYTLDSDNKKLLELLKDARYNKETKQKESVPYLPIATIYSLLEQFYPNYSFESRPLDIEKTYTVTKQKMNWATKQKETTEEEAILFKKSIKLIIPSNNPSEQPRTIEWEARWVASIDMITLDQIYNWYSMKTESRAIKNACKKLGRVFRIPWDREEIMEVDSIKSDLSITDVIKSINSWAKKDEPKQEDTNNSNVDFKDEITSLIEKDYKDLIEEFNKTNEWVKITIVDLQQMWVKLRDKHWFKKWDEQDELMKKVYNQLKTELSL